MKKKILMLLFTSYKLKLVKPVLFRLLILELNYENNHSLMKAPFKVNLLTAFIVVVKIFRAKNSD